MDKQTIGTLVGKVPHTFGITNDVGEKAQLTITIDFSTASDNDIKGWLVANRIIAGQRPWRTLSVDELKALNGLVFIAEAIGRKVKSREEQKAELKATFMNAGVDEKKAEQLATVALENPELLTVAESK